MNHATRILPERSFNKELLDLRVPLHRGLPAEEGKGQTLVRALEWDLQFYLMEYLFDRRTGGGSVPEKQEPNGVHRWVRHL